MGEEKREPSTHCFAHAPSSLGNLHTIPLHQNYFCLPAERPHCVDIILPVGHIRADLKSKTISLYQ